MNEMTKDASRELTFWEKSVCLTFNHGEGEIGEKIDTVKKAFAWVIDLIKKQSDESDTSYMSNTLYQMAFSTCIAAQMAVVKFITWKT